MHAVLINNYFLAILAILLSICTLFFSGYLFWKRVRIIEKNINKFREPLLSTYLYFESGKELKASLVIKNFGNSPAILTACYFDHKDMKYNFYELFKNVYSSEYMINKTFSNEHRICKFSQILGTNEKITLFVLNFNRSVSDKDLKELFSRIYRINDFIFIEFETTYDNQKRIYAGPICGEQDYVLAQDQLSKVRNG